MEEQASQQTYAVLIDGDNAQAALLPRILEEVSKFGLITIKRIYGDWTTPAMNQWKDTLHLHAIQPVQQFRNTVGKNATDSAMIIDAMDLLHDNDLQGFCIVSSDSDYTRLATRIREKGLFVIGVGVQKTPEAFVNACNQFIYTENLQPAMAPKRRSRRRRKKSDSAEPAELTEPEGILLKGFEMSAKDEGWTYLSTLGNRLRQLNPAFDPRTYHRPNLISLLKDFPGTFVVKHDRTKNPPVITVALKSGPGSD
ncbi:MAG: NYN domain-containing protein [Chloroflexota bacterium]